MIQLTLTNDQRELLRFGYRYINYEKNISYSFFPSWLKENTETGTYELIDLKDVPKDIIKEVFDDMLYGTGYVQHNSTANPLRAGKDQQTDGI